MPKFVFADIPIFKGMLQDLFPGVSPTPDSYKKFVEKVEESLKEKEYKIVPEQVRNKCCLLRFTLPG